MTQYFLSLQKFKHMLKTEKQAIIDGVVEEISHICSDMRKPERLSKKRKILQNLKAELNKGQTQPSESNVYKIVSKNLLFKIRQSHLLKAILK